MICFYVAKGVSRLVLEPIPHHLDYAATIQYKCYGIDLDPIQYFRLIDLRIAD